MKKSLLFLLLALIGVFNAFSQSDISGPGIGHQRLPGRFSGWSPAAPGSVAGSFELRNDFINQPINFFTTNTGAPIQRMTILGTNGFVGIGNSGSALNPLWQLDVNDNANLNINYNGFPGYGYRINGNKILSNPGTKNIFVGNGAGTGWSSLSPINYTQAKAVFF